MKCPQCEQTIQADWNVCPNCQTPLRQDASPYASPAKVLQVPAQDVGDATGGIIPYKNPKALLAYYLGIASGLPIIGLPFGIAAFILGILGLREKKRNPVIKGSVHAWIGIGCGGVFMILWGILLVGLVLSAFVG